ncbi:MAG: DsbA family protein [Pseudohongiellaceae bacterium]
MSKKEEQRRIREQKQQAAARKARIRSNMTRVAAVIGIPLLVIAVLYGLLSQGTAYPPDQVAESDQVRGNPDGVTLVIYSDFQCPACATEARLLSRAWPRIADDVQLVYRHFPLTDTHRHAWTAALYAEAAGRQDSFWSMHDLLFANQSYWSGLSDVEAEFDGYLEQLGLDVARAHEDMEDEALRQKVRNDQRGGTRAGVRGTPALFVDGRQVRTPGNVADLRDLINDAG